MTRNWKQYLLYFAQEHVNFRNAEFESLVKLFSLQWRKISPNSMKPFWIVEFPDDESAIKFASRSIALRGIFELWAHGNSSEVFHKNLKGYIKDNIENVHPYFQRDCSFKITVESYNKHFSHKEKIDKIESLEELEVQGKVDLNAPHVEWWYIEFWGLDPSAVPDIPEDILFGRLLANGQRHLINELSLKSRKFIGNTSMDAQLSILMANQGLVGEADFVFDPFVGTGSLLVSAAKFGAYVMGADIDFMMCHARSRPSRIRQKIRDKDESILANLHQYECGHKYIDIVVSDFSNPLWRNGVQFDSIITDPPYGIREATERIETKITPRSHLRTEDMQHYPSTSHYALQHLYTDLLVFAAKHLKIGGRLVCWLPFHREDYSDNMVPTHPNLMLISNCEQPLTGPTSRRLLTYEKHSAPCNDTNWAPNAENIKYSTESTNQHYYQNKGIKQEQQIKNINTHHQSLQESIKRDKQPSKNRERKRNLNKARFN